MNIVESAMSFCPDLEVIGMSGGNAVRDQNILAGDQGAAFQTDGIILGINAASPDYHPVT